VELKSLVKVACTGEIIPYPSVVFTFPVAKANFFINGELILVLQYQDSPIGVLSKVISTFIGADGEERVLVKGEIRARLIEIFEVDKATYSILDFAQDNNTVDEILLNKLKNDLIQLVKEGGIDEEILVALDEITTPSKLADILISQLSNDFDELNSALNINSTNALLDFAFKVLQSYRLKINIEFQINDEVTSKIEKSQKELYLREQLRVIQHQLDESDEYSDELKQLKNRLDISKIPQEIQLEGFRQLRRLERLTFESAEYSMLRSYIEWILDLPWGKRSRDKLDPKRAKRILDRDHFGLEKAKDRIIEFLCVRRLNRSIKGPILCFVGPPGVGKTSLGRSVASALGRKYARIALGGVRDEAEIRGHRRTYIGALPGRIIQTIKNVGTINPVIVLDELDKIGADVRGDPASALLEVLDSQQNKEFRDHYLNLSIDLSEILFIATANNIDIIPDALLDRLELIYISGYTLEEKKQIASKFIVPRQLQENGLSAEAIKFGDESLNFLIEHYTEEAGVRNLEREIGSLCRKLVRIFVERGEFSEHMTKDLIIELLGATKFDPEQRGIKNLVGVVHGLAWTLNGGELMPIEVSIAQGNGNLTLTGQLGSVMQESAQTAVFYARSHALELGLSPKFHQEYDIHVHVPSGATPKDGPSAGITIACALVSALSGKPVSNKVAMTGEITLRGMVLPVGGLKEKVIAALRHGFETIIVPCGNKKDLTEIRSPSLEKAKIIFVDNVDEVFRYALLKKKR
jgi:ATP-dependent Lon protease